MMELLKRFEEQSGEDDLDDLSGDGDDNSDDESGLESRLANIDLGKACVADWVSRLTHSRFHRERDLRGHMGYSYGRRAR